MHGLKKEMEFPFKVEIEFDEDKKQKLLTVDGEWLINRKDFDIVWSKILDKGGIMVGNYVAVVWGIKSLI